MTRNLLLPRPASSAIAPAFLRVLRAAPACLLAGSLLAAAGCGDDNQRVPENFPSGARPAPLPAADLAAGRTELPPPPPAEPNVEPTPPAKNPAAQAPTGTGRPGAGAQP